MHWGMHVSTRASALALALVAVAVLGGPASATAYQFYDGVSDPPPNYPTGGTGIDVFKPNRSPPARHTSSRR